MVKITRRWLGTALAPVTFGAAAALIVGTLAGSPSAPRPSSRLSAAVQSYRSRPSLADCLGHSQVRPASITLACADGNSSITGIRWRSWQATADGQGTWLINDCTPFCARGTVHRFPVQVVLSAPERVNGAHFRRYTKLTMILPDGRCYTAGDKRTCYPARSVQSLLPQYPSSTPGTNLQVATAPLAATVR